MTPAGLILQEEIERDGPITFHRFMDIALYHPEHGYYRRERDPFGKAGDFYTAEQLQPVFGILIAAVMRALASESFCAPASGAVPPRSPPHAAASVSSSEPTQRTQALPNQDERRTERRRADDALEKIVCNGNPGRRTDWILYAHRFAIVLSPG